MLKDEIKNTRSVKQLSINIPCYFYGYFKSPGLETYPNLNWVNEDYSLIKTKNLNKKTSKRLAKNLYNVGKKYNLFQNLDYIIMMPVKAKSISSLKIVINELWQLISININNKVKFIDDIFLISDYQKFWENKLNIDERKKAILNKISLKPEYNQFFNNKKLLIIDDVISTGVSIADIALILNSHNSNLQLSALCYGSVYNWEKIYT